MIFVAVGTQKFPFNRLLKKIDDLKEQGVLADQVFAQTGHSDYIPRNYGYKDFLSQEEFHSAIADCDILITHSGVATIISGLKLGKPVVVAPRFAVFGEHVDDHQLQIAQSFSDKNFVLMCRDLEGLADTVNQARTHEFAEYVSRREGILQTLREYLAGI